MCALVKCTFKILGCKQYIFMLTRGNLILRTFRLLFTVFKIDNFACRMYCFLTAVFLSFARLVSWIFTLT